MSLPAEMAPFTADPGGVLIALDFDGTLARIVENPEEAVAHPEVPGVLARLDTEVGCLAVITGRPARVAASRSGLGSIAVTRMARGGTVRPDHLVVLGHYGAERWDGSTLQVIAQPVPPGVDEAKRIVQQWLDDGTLPADATFEDKGRSLAVHTRTVDDPAKAAEQVERQLRPLADRLDLAVEPGRYVVEVRPPGIDKGRALRMLIERVRPTGVIYLGDDLGDLPAFAVVAEMRAQGRPALAVCSASDEVPELREQADVVVDGPGGVADWLRRLAVALRQAEAER